MGYTVKASGSARLVPTALEPLENILRLGGQLPGGAGKDHIIGLVEFLALVRMELLRLGVTFNDIARVANSTRYLVRQEFHGQATMTLRTAATAAELATAAQAQARSRNKRRRPVNPAELPQLPSAREAGRPVMINGSHSAPVTAWRSAPPDPAQVASVKELRSKLVELHVWDGSPSLRTLAERSPLLSRSTVSDMLRGRGQLPKRDLLRAFVEACGAGSDWPRWDLSWQRLRLPAGRW